MHCFRKSRSSEADETMANNPRALLVKHRLKSLLCDDPHKVITLHQDASVEQALRVRRRTSCILYAVPPPAMQL